MSGPVSAHPSGSHVETVVHGVYTSAMDVAANTLGLFALNASGLPEKLAMPSDGPWTTAMKEALVFQAVTEARRALARGGYSLHSMYGMGMGSGGY